MGNRGRGRPRKTWDEIVRGDLKTKDIHHDVVQDRVAWKKAISMAHCVLLFMDVLLRKEPVVLENQCQ